MTTAIERGDLAESLVPVAAELAWLVRDESREAIGEWLDGQGITGEKARALLVVLAARSPVDVTDEQALDWVTFDEFGRPLDQTIPLLPVLPVSGDHGTYAAYQRHKLAGDSKGEMEDCGCMRAARAYWNAQREAQREARRAAARDRRAGAGEEQQRQGEAA